jgi:bacterioferritin
MHIGADVPKMFSSDHTFESNAIKHNTFIVTCAEAKDYATREILESILNDEDQHINEIEEVQDEIAQMICNFSFHSALVGRAHTYHSPLGRMVR